MPSTASGRIWDKVTGWCSQLHGHGGLIHRNVASFISIVNYYGSTLCDGDDDPLIAAAKAVSGHRYKHHTEKDPRDIVSQADDAADGDA